MPAKIARRATLKPGQLPAGVRDVKRIDLDMPWRLPASRLITPPPETDEPLGVARVAPGQTLHVEWDNGLREA